MGLRLPESRQSEAPRPQRRRVDTEAILRVMGNNPYAQAIDNITPALSEALMQRAQARKMAQQQAALSEVTGADPQMLSRLSPEAANLYASSLMKQRESEKVKEASLPKIRALEKSLGAKEGELGDDYDTAKLMFTQSSIEKRMRENPNLGLRERGLEMGEDSKFKNRLNNQKNRLINDPRVKPLFTQDIGLKQVGDILSMVQQGNTVAAGALGVKMAKAMGEVGVLTDQDVARYVVSGRLDRAAGDKLSKMIRGVPSEATQAELSQISQVLRESFADRIQPIYNEYITSFAETEGVDPSEVSRKMAIPYSKPAPAQLPSLPGARKATMRWNSQTGRLEPVQ